MSLRVRGGRTVIEEIVKSEEGMLNQLLVNNKNMENRRIVGAEQHCISYMRLVHLTMRTAESKFLYSLNCFCQCPVNFRSSKLNQTCSTSPAMYRDFHDDMKFITGTQLFSTKWFILNEPASLSCLADYPYFLGSVSYWQSVGHHIWKYGAANQYEVRQYDTSVEQSCLTLSDNFFQHCKVVRHLSVKHRCITVYYSVEQSCPTMSNYFVRH